MASTIALKQESTVNLDSAITGMKVLLASLWWAYHIAELRPLTHALGAREIGKVII